MNIKGIILKQALQTANIKQEEAAKVLGISRPTLSIWCNKEFLGTEIIDAIKEKLDIDLTNVRQDLNEDKGVPYYDSDVTGSIVGSFHDITEKPVFFVDFKPFNDCDAYFTIAGDSMYPKYQAGEILAVKQVRNFDMIQWGESYLIIGDASTDDIRTVKNVHFNDRDDSKIILRASNPNFKGDTPMKKEAILSMYIIKGKIKKEQL